jgi:hypothetical protein
MYFRGELDVIYDFTVFKLPGVKAQGGMSHAGARLRIDPVCELSACIVQ